MTVVLITHHMDECIGTDRVLIMADGFLVADGTPRELFSQPELMEKNGLDVPETVKLMADLNRQGWDLPLSALQIEECAEEIRKGIGA